MYPKIIPINKKLGQFRDLVIQQPHRFTGRLNDPLRHLAEDYGDAEGQFPEHHNPGPS